MKWEVTNLYSFKNNTPMLTMIIIDHAAVDDKKDDNDSSGDTDCGYGSVIMIMMF